METPCGTSFGVEGTGAVRRTLTGRTHRFHIRPMRGMEQLPDGRWRAVEPGAVIALCPEEGAPLPVGDLRLELEVSSAQPLHPALVLDSGAGFGDGLRIPLPAPGAGRIRALVAIPATTVGLGFEPGAAELRLGAVRANELSLVGALLAHAVPELGRLLRSPRRLAVMSARAARLLRYRGIPGVLERLRRATRQSMEDGYEQWAQRYSELSDVQRHAIRARVDMLRSRPLVTLLLAPRGASEVMLRRTLESVSGQLYPRWELRLVEAKDAGELPPALARRNGDPRVLLEAAEASLTRAKGEVVMRIAGGDFLAEHALFALAEAVEAHPDLVLLYTDEDSVDAAGRRSPAFKPDWSPELLRSRDYIGRSAFFSTARARALGGWREGPAGVAEHEFLLRYIAGLDPGCIVHLPAVLLRQAIAPPKPPDAGEPGAGALQASLDAAGVRARVEPGSRAGTFHVRYALPDPAPLVSVIIPTRDRGELLGRCLRSLEATRYRPIEVLIVDNESRDPRTVRLLDSLVREGKARVLRYPHPFNYSAMNNLAVGEAHGELLCLLNNDIEAIDPGWLTEMVGLALQPGVGAVGAKLLYPDGTVQHAGVVAGLIGVAAHSYVREPGGSDGYLLQLQTTREVAAVTGACMVLRRDRFLEVGGLDEAELGVAFNDTDLCFKLVRAGYRNLWTPYAELYHLESASRPSEEEPAGRRRFLAEEAVMRARWPSLILRDPYYSPNLSLDSQSPRPAWPPRVAWSWTGRGAP